MSGPWTQTQGLLRTGAPAAGMLAAWGSAWLAGEVGADDVLAAVDPDSLATVHGLPDEPGPAPLLSLLGAWRRAGTTRLAAALVVPGDPVGLPPVGEYATAARDAGQGVHALDGRETWAAVPQVTTHGNAVEGVTVSSVWRCVPVAPLAPAPVQVTEAAQTLRLALADATRQLLDLEVARWRPDVAGPLESLRRGRGREHHLPPGWPARAAELLGEAHRLGAILALGEADEGGAVTAAEAQQRRTALAELGRAVHRARLAGWNAHLEPRRA